MASAVGRTGGSFATPAPRVGKGVVHTALVHIHALALRNTRHFLQERLALQGSAGPQTLTIEPALFLRVQPIFFIAKDKVL